MLKDLICASLRASAEIDTEAPSISVPLPTVTVASASLQAAPTLNGLLESMKKRTLSVAVPVSPNRRLVPALALMSIAPPLMVAPARAIPASASCSEMIGVSLPVRSVASNVMSPAT